MQRIQSVALNKCAPVENRAFKVQRLALLTNTLFTSAKSAKVLSGLGRHIGVKFENDAVCLPGADGNVKPPDSAFLDETGLNEK